MSTWLISYQAKQLRKMGGRFSGRDWDGMEEDPRIGEYWVETARIVGLLGGMGDGMMARRTEVDGY